MSAIVTNWSTNIIFSMTITRKKVPHGLKSKDINKSTREPVNGTAITIIQVEPLGNCFTELMQYKVTTKAGGTFGIDKLLLTANQQFDRLHVGV